MINKLKPKSEYVRNVLTLMTGTTIAQAIPIGISPILTRIYTPEDFGMFALYMSIVSILTTIATGRYELAIMLPKKDDDAVNVVALSILISVAVSLVVLAIVFIFNDQFTRLLGDPKISKWLYCIPISVLLTGIYKSLYYWCNRKKRYKGLSVSRVVETGTTGSTKVGMGLLGFGGGGLVLGGVFGQSIATAILSKMVWNIDKDKIEQVDNARIISLAKKYIDHPKYLTVSHGVSTFYLQIPIFFIGNFFNLTYLGFYSLAKRFVNLPSTLVASSIGDVFRQRATEEYHKTGKFDKILLITLKKTFAISIVPFTLLYFTIEDIFAFVFSEQWRIAGEYAQILVIGAFFSFVITPIDKAALIVNQMRYIFLWHVGRLVFYFAVVIAGYYFSFTIYQFLYGIVIVNIIFYLYDLYKELKFSRGVN